ncbi:hypothetical protein OOK31_17405 [Streptomyces sp. NBC_00249]|uniref:hypothetical protein n=1 Tax=Streptomyces sp. NBC_00249 TaxID=2975690 RepID=UPI00225317E8|nr:hypothetical protein [Streptomyces sp. NBC_00249]MCX5195660.1 hypothetical protein [Streptomyces sp. NBC_00249]
MLSFLLPPRRPRSAAAAARAVTRYRRPGTAHWRVIAEALCRGDWQAQHPAVQAGPALAPYADRLAARLRRTQDETLALALAGTGDVRAVPALQALAEADRMPSDRIHASTLAALPAAALLPALRAQLRHPAGMSTLVVLDVLAAWGPDAAPAVPEVAAHLAETSAGYAAARALGRIGPAAAAAAEALAAHATGRTWHGTRMAAWAHARVTGDDSLALAACAADLDAGLGSRTLPYLADLGPAAGRHADTVRALMDSPGEWTRVAAAHAWWRITGDPEPALPVLTATVAAGWTGHPARPVPNAVRHLGAIGRPSAGAAPALSALLAAEERVPEPFEGRRILVDDRFAADLTRALERISGQPPLSESPS